MEKMLGSELKIFFGGGDSVDHDSCLLPVIIYGLCRNLLTLKTTSTNSKGHPLEFCQASLLKWSLLAPIKCTRFSICQRPALRV